MLRTLTTAAILALTVIAAQAEDSLSTRIHDAAVAACAPERSSSLPLSHYGTISARCVERITSTAMTKYQTDADVKTMASTASAN
jgi:hypothetical protein